MFSICTSFDENYFKWGYPLICSAFIHYPTEIFVYAINLSSRHCKSLRKIGVNVSNVVRSNDTDYSYECFAAKAYSVLEAMSKTSKDAVAFIDADSLIESSLNDFEKTFSGFDLCVTKRDRGKEHLVFCSNNIFVRRNEHCRKMVEDWVSMIPNWKTDLPISRAYAEQACLYLSFIKHHEKIRFLNAEDTKIPIFHAKGSKYTKHKDYQQARYQERCDSVVEEFCHRENI